MIRIFTKYTELFNSKVLKMFFTSNIPKTYCENILKMLGRATNFQQTQRAKNLRACTVSTKTKDCLQISLEINFKPCVNSLFSES